MCSFYIFSGMAISALDVDWATSLIQSQLFVFRCIFADDCIVSKSCSIKTAVALFFLNVWSQLSADRTGLTRPQLLVLHRSLTGRTAAETSFYRPTDRASEGVREGVTAASAAAARCLQFPAPRSHREPLALLGPCLPPIRSRQLTSELCAAGVRSEATCE